MNNIQRTPPLLTGLTLAAGLALILAFYLVMFYAPVEIEMGLVQKVFYFHVASTWTGMLGLSLAAVSSAAYLKSGNLKWDTAALAGIEIAMVFIALGMITGSIWARPIWNTWWTWDPRLTTTLIMELIYAAYMVLRSGIDDPLRRAKFSAVYAIAGFISVPLTFISIRVFRTIHPVLVAGGSGSDMFSMTDAMKFTFFFSLAAFSLLFVVLFWHRYRLGLLQGELDRIKNDILMEG